MITPTGQIAVPEDTVSSSTFQALVGLGSRIGGPDVLNYSLNNNVLAGQVTGRSTPQILVGGSFQLYDPDRRNRWPIGRCFRFMKNGKMGKGTVAPIVPTSIFVNLQLAPNSDNVLNGYTFGGESRD